MVDRTRNYGSTDRELGSQFRNPGRDMAGGMRYVDPGGAPRDVIGDTEAPFLKVPPFLSAIEPWVKVLPLPSSDGGDYVTLPGLDCVQDSFISVYFNILLIGEGQQRSQLSIVPQARAVDDEGNEDWYALAVVDPTVTIVSDGNVFPFPLGSRSFSPSELRGPDWTGNAGDRMKFNLSWDVRMFEAFRLSLLDLQGSSATIDIFYALSQ